MTCLLCVEQGVDEFFAVVRGVGTCLLGVELRVEEFAVVKGVDDVLADVEQGVYGGLYGDLAVDGFFRGFSAVFALLRVIPELSASFRSPRALTLVSAGGLLHNFMLRVC